MLSLNQGLPPDPVRDALYDLLRVIADPAAAKKRLDDLTAAKADADQTLTAAQAVVVRAAKDKAEADTVLAAARAEAQTHKDAADARDAELNHRESNLKSQAVSLAAAQQTHVEKSTAKETDLKAREDALAFRERHVEDLHRKADGDAKAAVDLRTQLERKLAAIASAAA